MRGRACKQGRCVTCLPAETGLKSIGKCSENVLFSCKPPATTASAQPSCHLYKTLSSTNRSCPHTQPRLKTALPHAQTRNLLPSQVFTRSWPRPHACQRKCCRCLTNGCPMLTCTTRTTRTTCCWSQQATLCCLDPTASYPCAPILTRGRALEVAKVNNALLYFLGEMGDTHLAATRLPQEKTVKSAGVKGVRNKLGKSDTAQTHNAKSVKAPQKVTRRGNTCVKL